MFFFSFFLELISIDLICPGGSGDIGVDKKKVVKFHYRESYVTAGYLAYIYLGGFICMTGRSGFVSMTGSGQFYAACCLDVDNRDKDSSRRKEGKF